MPRLAHQLLALPAALSIAAAPCAAQRASYITTLGKDTLSFEQFTRRDDQIVGDWVTLYGGIMVHHYDIQLGPNGTVRRYQLTLHRLSGAVDGSVDLRFTADSVLVRNERGEEQRVALSGVMPTFASSIALLDLIVSRARATHRDSSVTPVLAAFGPYRRGGMSVVFLGHDSAWLGNSQRPLHARFDADGHIQALSARSTTTRSETRRVPAYDLMVTVSHFPNIPDSVPILGAPSISPRDTVRAAIGDAAVLIDYGRPAARGRDVFANNGVLGDSVWRTGANAATQFTTTRDLVVGRDTLPAGAYSLWTRVSRGGSHYTLVFNSQTGQWGTEHHSDRDVLSVPLERTTLTAPVERFTIRLRSSKSAGDLRLEWAKTALVVPLRPKS
ncbi:MAG: DUF2911 domain-containing protein [Gemmatimonadales bacterium]